MLFQMTRAALRTERPEMSEREAFPCAAARRLDAATMMAVYEWNPAGAWNGMFHKALSP